MNNLKLVKFEEVTPTLFRVAYFDSHLAELISHLNLPIYGAYDGLDEMVFAFLTLPSGRTVTLGEYANSPRIGVDLYVDSKMDDIPAAIYEGCQQVGIPKSQVVWFRDKFQSEIDQLFIEEGDIKEIEKSVEIEFREVIYDPITCFLHSLKIYDPGRFPEYWAMLQYNLGSAYYQAFQSGDGDQLHNLTRAIYCYSQSELIYTVRRYPKRWRISQEVFRQVKVLRFMNLTGANLGGANLSGADLSGADLSGANLSGANLSGADLSGADLSSLSYVETDLSGAKFSNSIVTGATFTYPIGLSVELQKDLQQRGAIFDDRPPVDSRSIISSHS